MNSSAIRKELESVASTDPKSKAAWKPQAAGEDQQAYYTRLQNTIAKLISDDGWNSLGVEAQDWNNAAADAILAGQPIAEFPDATAPAPAPAPAGGRRRGGAAAEAPAAPAAFEPKAGDRVVITTKRGKVIEGVIVDMDPDTYVLNKDGEAGEKESDVEVPVATVAALALSNTPEAAAAGPSQEAAPGDAEPLVPEVGDTIQVVTARDKNILGKVKVIEGDELVLEDSTGFEHELVISKLKSAVVKVQANPKAATTQPAAAQTRTRGGAAAAPAPAAGGDKQARSSNAPGVSVGGRVRELLVEDPTLTVDQVVAKMKAEKIEFREASVKMIHKDTKHVIDLMSKGKGRK